MSSSARALVILLAAACSSGAPPAGAPGPSPGPSTPAPAIDPVRNTPTPEALVTYPRGGGGLARYAFARLDSVRAAMPTGEEQVQVLSRTAFVTLAWVAADTGTRISLAIDSVTGDGGSTSVQAVLDSARGARWTALRHANGLLTVTAGGPRSLVGDQVRDELQLLFPILPVGGVAAGQTWSDTATTPVRVTAFDASEVAQITSHAEPSGSVGGGLDLAVVRNRTASGEGSQFGQPISIQATGTDTLAYQMAGDGRVLRVQGVRLTDLVVSLPSVGQSVPARERSELLMTYLR
jgi:hypothetical protein